MNREVEERIVAMYFDNKDFEKNAKTTIDTLGQLKESLVIDDKGAEKSFSVFEKIGKVLDFSKANQGLTRMKSTMSSMGNFFKNAFKLDGLNDAERKLNGFKHNYLDRVIGFDIADKLVHSVENAFRQLTIQPISAGWDQYQSKMDSVKTIMSSTGEDLNTVEKYLSEMTDYANKTIYSLTDMTSNLGKFTNNGIDLQRSVQAMEGIANATADAGQGAQQASMAMYNISQAMGVGKMTTIDWKSLENANIATQKLKNTFLEMAAASGKLKKEVKEVAGKQVTQYFLETDDEGKKLKERIELTAANFREYLSKGWLDKEVMLRTFQIYSGQGVDVDLLESWGITDKKQQQELIEMGQQALESATQVRTFSKMMDALSESVQSSWAETFELIFGNMEQGTALWTKLSEEIDGILSKSAEVRNNILKIWSGEYISTESEKKQLEDKQATLEQLETYLSQLEESNDPEKVGQRIKDLKAQIQKYKDEITAFTNEKDQNGKKVDNSEKIKQRQQRVKELEATLKELQQKEKELDKQRQNQVKAGQYDAEIQKYKDEIAALEKSDVKGKDGAEDPDKVKKRDRMIAEKQKKMQEIQKKRDQLIGSSNQEIEKTKKEIAALQEDIDTLNRLIDEKESTAKSEYVDEEGRSGRDIAIDSLYKIIDLVKSLGSAVSEAFHNVFGSMDAGKLFDMTVKVEEAVKRLAAWFGEASDSSSRLYKIQKGLQGVFSVLKAGWKVVSGVFNLLKRLAAPVLDALVEAFGTIGGFFDGIGDLNISEMFTKIGDGVRVLWNRIKTFFSSQDGGESPFATWARNAWQDFKTIIRSWANDVGLGGVIDAISRAWHAVADWEGWAAIGKFFSDIWGWISDTWGNVTAWFTMKEDGTQSGFSKFITEVRDKVVEIWDDLVGWEGWESIGSFFSDVWKWITGKAKDVLGWFTEDDDGTGTGFSKFISGVYMTVVGAWNGLKGWDGWESIGSFFTNIWTWITGKTKDALAWFTEDDDGTGTGFSKFISGVYTTIVGAWNGLKGWDGWESIGSFFTDVWAWITGKAKDAIAWFTEDDDGTGTGFSKFISGVYTAVIGAWNGIKGWEGWDSVASFFTDVWTWITGKAKDAIAWFTDKEDGGDTGFVKFLKDMKTGVENTWNDIVGWEGWKEIGRFFSNTWKWITDLISGKAGREDSGEGATTVAENAEGLATVTEAVQDALGDTGESAEQGASIFERIVGAITGLLDKINGVVIPPEVQTFFDGLSTFFMGMLEFIGKTLRGIGKIAKGDLSGFGDIWFPLLLVVAEQILTMVNNKRLAGISGGQSFATKFLEIAGGLFLMATAVGILTAIDQDKMWTAVGAIAVLGAVVTGIIGIISNLTGGKGLTTTKSERILNNLISTLGKLGTIFIVMKMLPDVIKAFGEAKQAAGGADFGQDALNMMLGLTAMIAGVSVVFAAVEKISGGQGLNPVATLKTAISIIEVLGIVLLAFVGTGGLLGILQDLIGEDAIDTIISGIDKLSEIFSSIGGVIGRFFSSLFGGGSSEQKAKDAADATQVTMEALSNMAYALDTEKVAGISRIISLVQNLSQGSEMIDSKKLENFAIAMQRVGAGVYEIAQYILQMNGPLSEINDPNSEATQKLRSFIGYTHDIMEAMAPLGSTEYDVNKMLSDLDWLSTGDRLEWFVTSLNALLSGLGDLDDPNGGIQFDGLTIAGKLFKAIQDGLLDPKLDKFDATPVVDAILEALLLGDTAIAQTVHDMVQMGLNLNKNPTGENTGYQLDNAQSGLLAGIFNGGTVDYASLFNTDGLTKQLFGEDGKGGVLAEFTKFEEQVPSVESIFDSKGWLSFKGENGEDLDIVSEIQGQLNDLGTTLSNIDPLKITITPVFDYQNLTPEAIQAHMGSMPIKFLTGPSTNSLRIEFTGLSTELGMDAIRQKLDEIASRISVWGANEVLSTNNLGGHMSDIATNISRLKVVLDTNKMVGEMVPLIDFELMRRSNVYGRTGVK